MIPYNCWQKKVQHIAPNKSERYQNRYFSYLPGHVAQLVMCLATDASLTADPGVVSLILARSHTFVEIDHEIISTVILLPSAQLFKKGCCQLQAKVCTQSTGQLLVQACPGKSVVTVNVLKFRTL